VQQRTTSPAPGRHRAFVAPRVLGDRDRFAILTAALVAGIGVAGFSAATASATPPRLAVARFAPLEPTEPPALDSGTPSTATIDDTEDGSAPVQLGALSFARTQFKLRPVAAPVVVPLLLSQWVNPLPEAAVTSCFGQRWGRLHAGVDLAAADGTRIRAAGAGVVVRAGPAQGYGNAVLIDHGNGFLTHYGHLSVITVRPGQQVSAGEQIGNEGSTGHATGPHLHFEVHQGFYQNPIEPTQWMHAHGVDIPGCVTFAK